MPHIFIFAIMLKKIITTILLIFIVNFLFAQHTFEKIISKVEDQVINQVVEDSEGNFVLVGRIHNIETSYAAGYIIKIDSTGNVLQENIFQQTDTNSCNFYNIHCFDDHYYILGQRIFVYPDTTKIWFLILNSSLEIENEKFLNILNNRWFSYMNSIIDTDSNFVIAGFTTREDSIQVYHNDPVFYKISMNGDSISSNFMNKPIKNRFAFDIIENFDSSAYYAFVSRFENSSAGQKLILNKNMDSINIQPIPLGIHDNYSPIILTDSSILLCGKGVPQQSAFYALNVFSINDQTELIDYNHFKIEGDMHDHPSMYNGVSKNGDNIYVGGTSNFDYYNPFYSYNDSWFHLIKINPDITSIWEYWYGGDAYYHLYSILATNDGGCLLVGNRYDYETQDVERDIYILKVDEDGIVTWTQEIPLTEKQTIIYPNPGTSCLNIKTKLKNSTFELIDFTGKIILRKEINSEIEQINTNNIPSGIYFYRIHDNEKIIESGKWVKR